MAICVLFSIVGRLVYVGFNLSLDAAPEDRKKPIRKLKDFLCKPKDRLEPKKICGPVNKIG